MNMKKKKWTFPQTDAFTIDIRRNSLENKNLNNAEGSKKAIFSICCAKSHNFKNRVSKNHTILPFKIRFNDLLTDYIWRVLYFCYGNPRHSTLF